MKPNSVRTARSFASDNNAGVHPEILAAIARANEGHVVAYGADPYTQTAIKKFEEHFGEDIAVFFTFNGTGANVLGLQALTRSFQSILCSDYAHIYTDECGAPEKHTGCKLIPLPHQDGKISLDSVRHAYRGIGDEHHSQPRVVSITQSTEMGTVYRPEEIQALAKFAHEHDMFLHMDGARISNAAAHLGCSLAEIAACADVLSFGGTKNGALGVEAVLVMADPIGDGAQYQRKQQMQLASKMRFLSAQIDALLADDLWRTTAARANAMAQRLANNLAELPGVRLAYPVHANGVFIEIGRQKAQLLQRDWNLQVWAEGPGNRCVVRLMTAFDTSPQDVDTLASAIKAALVSRET